MRGVKANTGVRVENARFREPPVGQLPHALPVQAMSLTATNQCPPLSVALYERILDALDIETAAETMDAGGSIRIDKVAVKRALESGAEIPGTALVTDRKTLVRK